VKFKTLREGWNSFFFTPQSPTPIALFRIIYGLLVIATLALLHGDWLAWYGPNAWTSLHTMHLLEPGPRLSLFSILPPSNSWIEIFFWVFLLSAVLLTIGFFTRTSTAIVFLCLASIDQRNLFITHGGDTFLRVAGFFLIFAPAGAAISVDRFLRMRSGKEGAEIALRAPWAQRMIQLELALVYFATFCWKAKGVMWVQGTALYYVYHLDEIRRFYLPHWMMQPVLLKLGSWYALVLEFSLGILIWFREIRYYLLALGVLFHLSIEYSLNLPLFQWDILSAYVLFIDPRDLSQFWNWFCRRAGIDPARMMATFERGSRQTARS
jgi:Vitamin K-dependent gamma-carboxylase